MFKMFNFQPYNENGWWVFYRDVARLEFSPPRGLVMETVDGDEYSKHRGKGRSAW